MYYFWRKVVSIFFHIKYHITVHGAENIPAMKGGYVIASNHQFYSDPPMLAAVIRGKFSFMAKSELFKNKIFGWLIKRCGAFPVERGKGDNEALEKAIADIKNGRTFVIFPEGTRSKDGSIGRGHSGIIVIASQADAPILPVCIMYGLGGKKRNVDVSIGPLIPAKQIEIDTSDRKSIRAATNLVMNGIKAQQEIIFNARGIAKPSEQPTDENE